MRVEFHRKEICAFHLGANPGIILIPPFWSVRVRMDCCLSNLRSFSISRQLIRGVRQDSPWLRARGRLWQKQPKAWQKIWWCWELQVSAN